MSKSPLVSIIVPIYRVEKYLRRCIESILTQTYSNWELILVDDGSPDQCGEICDEFARKDQRIRVIHQPNGGVVRARNAGIKIAIGKYLAFVDSDDYIEPYMYEELVSIAEIDQLQIVWCDWNEIKYNNTGKAETITVSAGFDTDTEKALKNLLTDKAKGFLWNKLIDKDYYYQCHIKTDDYCTIMEDKYILVQLIYNHPLMGYVQKPLYNYLTRNESATSLTNTISPLVRGADNVLHIHDFLQIKKSFPTYQREFYRLAMQVKFAITNSGNYHIAQNFIPSAHKSIDNYPITGLIAKFYWLYFNCGKVGQFLLRFKHLL